MIDRPRRHILVVDNKEEMIDMLNIVLREKDYTLTLRQNFNHLYRDLAALQPGLILINQDLRSQDVLTICKDIRGSTATQKLVLLLFGCGADGVSGYREAGVNAYFEKPKNVQDLLAAIEIYIY